MDDLISRQAVYNVLDKMPVRGFKKDGETIHGLISLSQVNSAIINLPSAQPEPKWIPFKTRPMTEEEKEEHPEWDCILDCKLPDDGQAILVSIDLRGHECVQYDEFYSDDGSYLDSGYEIGEEATAWMPLPEPYAERRTDETDYRKE